MLVSESAEGAAFRQMWTGPRMACVKDETPRGVSARHYAPVSG
jgi:hypothetical protein